MKGAAISRKYGQTAVEYLILLATITVVVLIGFDEQRGFMVRTRNLAEVSFNETLRNVMGPPPGAAARTHATSYP